MLALSGLTYPVKVSELCEIHFFFWLTFTRNGVTNDQKMFERQLNIMQLVNYFRDLGDSIPSQC